MIRIPLTQGKVTTIDDEDWDLVKDYKWHSSKKGDAFYATSRKVDPNGGSIFEKHKGKLYGAYPKRITIQMSRVIMNAKPDQMVDHKDQDTLNNCRYNLRFCDYAQNRYNSKKQTTYGSKKSSSKYKGVSWHKRRKNWQATIIRDYEHIHLGCFNSEEEAAIAYNHAAKLYSGQFANLNIVV